MADSKDHKLHDIVTAKSGAFNTRDNIVAAVAASHQIEDSNCTLVYTLPAANYQRKSTYRNKNLRHLQYPTGESSILLDFYLNFFLKMQIPGYI